MARVALPRPELAPDLKWLVFNTDLTLMADIHFDPTLAVLAMEAGCRAIRINPGNMPLNRLNDVIQTAKALGVTIRIGAGRCRADSWRPRGATGRRRCASRCGSRRSSCWARASRT